jgi:hypothetical protein
VGIPERTPWSFLRRGVSAGERREGGGLAVVDGRNEREDLLSSLRYHCKYQRVRGCDGGEGYED